jgi:hypothetical protein
MKFFKNIFLLFQLSLLFSNSIFAETEPNNTYSQASTLGLNITDSGAMNASSQGVLADDVDWWKVILPADGSLYIEVNTTGGMDVDLFIIDTDGQYQMAGYDISVGPKEATHHSHLMAGTYYIKATRYSGTGTYTIMSRFVQALYTNDSEVNDTYQQALTLQINSDNYGHIGYSRNTFTDPDDWWKVTLPYDGSLKIRTESDSADIDLFIYDINGTTQIAGYDISVGLNEETHHKSLMPGTFYIRVKGYGKWGGYKIHCEFTAAAYQSVTTNDNEPNDTYSQAQAFGTLATGSAIKYGHLGHYANNFTDEKDYWSFTVPQDGGVVVTTDTETRTDFLDIDLFMYDINGTTQIAGYDLSTGIKEQSHYYNLMPGTYYVQAKRYSYYGAYKITIAFTPATLANDSEPNDLQSQAKSILANTLMTGHLGYYSNNVTDMDDYFTITLSTNWDSLYVRTDSDATLEADLKLYNSAGTVIGSAGVYSKREILGYKTAVASTPYYIRVYRYGGYGSYGIKISNQYPKNPVTAVEEKKTEQLPTEFQLSQNYPNPFNPSTNIKYALPQNSFVSIKVYDILGREVKTLVSSELPAGNHSVVWKGDDNSGHSVSSGTYIYRIHTDNFVQTKKMILIK